jgi:hypothetical protein
VHWGDSNSALDSLYEEQSKEDNGVKWNIQPPFRALWCNSV